MWRYIIGGLFLAIVASEVPAMLDRATRNATVHDSSGSEGQRTEVARIEQKPSADEHEESYNPLAGRTAKINSDNRGHFLVDARLNGRRAQVLVDTGATSVAINKSMARRIGLRLTQADFKSSTHVRSAWTSRWPRHSWSNHRWKSRLYRFQRWRVCFVM